MYGIGAYFALMNAIKAFRPGKALPMIAPMTPERALCYLYEDESAEKATSVEHLAEEKK
jgi:xanthine dehydrogenase large subunit